MQDDAGEGRGEQVEVEVGADLAAVAGPLEDGAGDRELGPMKSRRNASANSGSR